MALRLTFSGCAFHQAVRQLSEQNLTRFLPGVCVSKAPHCRQNPASSSMRLLSAAFVPVIPILRQNATTVSFFSPTALAMVAYPNPCERRAVICSFLWLVIVVPPFRGFPSMTDLDKAARFGRKKYAHRTVMARWAFSRLSYLILAA